MTVGSPLVLTDTVSLGDCTTRTSPAPYGFEVVSGKTVVDDVSGGGGPMSGGTFCAACWTRVATVPTATLFDKVHRG